MNILFVHNNFPAQYLHVVRALANDPKVQMVAVGSSSAQTIDGVKLIKYSMGKVDVSATHPFARRFDVECYRAEQVLYALSSLASTGFKPEVILAHPGWGETLPLRTIFPNARIVLYCEFFYGTHGRDVGFDPEFPATGVDGHVALQLKNASTLLALADCDAGISPTDWQRSTFPQEYQHKITTIHEGIAADVVTPNPNAVLQLPSGRELRQADEIVTFVARNLEPLRGYHVFMRALPHIMSERPRAQIVIIGGDGVSYGASPPPGTTWKSIFFDEVAGQIDPERVHFVGRLPYADYLSALQISSAQIYLTYPFVLSWSLLEAMSAGCVIIGSDTDPVREVLNAKNGILVPFFDVEQLAERVVEVLEHPFQFTSLRAHARQTILDQYDLVQICLPKLLALIRGLSGASYSAPEASLPSSLNSSLPVA
jgi:glycosyltransferase involved in cell wall biosynthesis